MNYQNIHNQIIYKAQNRKLTRDVYTEEHHITPVSMSGSNEAYNLVKLTAKEHFVIHHLLWKIHRNQEMTKAFMLMCNTNRNGVKYKVSAKEYQLLKEDNRKFRSEFMTGRPGNNLGKTLPQEWKDNISKSLIGNKNAIGNTSFKGKTHTEEAKQKLSEKLKGNKNHLGILHSEETKKMMSENRKGKTKIPWTEERKAARSEMMRELHRKRREEKAP